MNGFFHRYPRYGTVGLVILVIMHTALFAAQSENLGDYPWWYITMWATPACWWGYILAVDAWIYRTKAKSLLASRRELFALQCILSIAFWCLFEAYNRLMPGWRYVNLTPHLPTRLLGYAVSFATIMPAMFLTVELLQTYQVFAGARLRPFVWNNAMLQASVVIGAVFCAVPPLLPEDIRGYFWACVWTGWFFLLEPINYWRGLPSIYRDWERGNWARTLQLFAAGAICGVLWEFWNMWAYTKWIYIFPLGQNLRFFEMPVVGFLGFLPFALEYFTMFHFVAGFFTREDKLGL
jgi:hypothetical protein